MCVLIFSTNFVWNFSHSKKKWARYNHKNIWVFMESTRYSCQILTLNLLRTTIVSPPSNASKWQLGFNSAFKGLMKLEFLRLPFEKLLTYKISWKYVEWEQSCSMRTDRQTYTTMPTVVFRNSSNTLKNDTFSCGSYQIISSIFRQQPIVDLNLLFPRNCQANEHCSSLGKLPWSKLTYQIFGLMLCSPPRPKPTLPPWHISHPFLYLLLLHAFKHFC